MSDGLVVSLLVLATLTGVGAAAFLVMRSPTFWVDVAKQIGSAVLPQIIKIVTKRMPPEDEKAWRDCMLKGGRWNHQKRRCE